LLFFRQRRATSCASPCLPALLALGLAATGCATDKPVAEVRALSEAFRQLDAASQPLLDDLALAERQQGRRNAEHQARRRDTSSATPASASDAAADPCASVVAIAGLPRGVPPVQDGFCTKDSPYYSEIADPPATASFRRGLAVVGDYTEALLVLAEDRNVDEARAQLQGLATNATAIAVAAGAVSGGATAAVPAAIAALQPVVDLAARDANARELERTLRENAPALEGLIGSLEDAAPALFNTLVAERMRRLRDPRESALAGENARWIEGYRASVSNYVLLLRSYRSLFADVLASYDQERGTATLAGLTQRSGDLAVRADAWRRTLAALRTGI
jgi:hypothetical protein